MHTLFAGQFLTYALNVKSLHELCGRSVILGVDSRDGRWIQVSRFSTIFDERQIVSSGLGICLGSLSYWSSSGTGCGVALGTYTAQATCGIQDCLRQQVSNCGQIHLSQFQSYLAVPSCGSSRKRWSFQCWMLWKSVEGGLCGSPRTEVTSLVVSGTPPVPRNWREVVSLSRLCASTSCTSRHSRSSPRFFRMRPTDYCPLEKESQRHQCRCCGLKGRLQEI
ncbi:uncharacterized protein IWZ02DRAFT_202747 [Phyllosticta citriasiana]|uniref:uncharacterized protein n=1 Tax=Phyllosticta citriasiana TaxID=595635 RepID=UPI0030FD651E